jgi:hypothetical protein
MAKTKIPEKDQPWIEARKRYHLSDAHIQMARELGLNPKKFGALEGALARVHRRAVLRALQEGPARECAVHRADGERFQEEESRAQTAKTNAATG